MLRRIYLPLLLVLVTVCSAHAQDETQTIRGQIIAPGRVNASDIDVTLEKFPNGRTFRTTTDTSGNFEFRSLDDGQYEVMVRLEGYHEFRQTVTIENPVNIPVDTADGADINAVPRPAVNTGLLGYVGIYVLLVRVGSTGSAASSDPEMVAISRKYPRKILEAYAKAQEENRKGNTAKAAERLESLLKEAPDFYTAHNDLGALYQRSNRYRDAEREYMRARDLNKQSALPLVSLGGLYLQEADATIEKAPDQVGRILDDALDILEEAIALEPHAAHAYYLLGTAYFKSEFFEEAEANLKQALEIENSHSSARLTLINVYLRQSEWQSALEQLDLYAAANPNGANLPQIRETRSIVVRNIEEAQK